MGSLKDTGSAAADRSLVTIAVGGLALPFAYFIVAQLLSFELSSLNAVFLLTLGRALIFSGVQAGLSAALACALALIASTWIATRAPSTASRLHAACTALGAFVFALPGTALALATLDLFRHLPGLPDTGGPAAIVWAHVTWNVGLLCAVFTRRLRSYFATPDAETLEAALLFGAGGRRLFLHALWPVLRPEAVAWSRLVFYWSFGAFSTLLILGDGPRHANPEVLLFYSLLNDNDGARLLLLAIVQGLVAWRITRLAPPPALHDESQHASASLPAAGALFRSRAALWSAAAAGIVCIFAAAWVLLGAPIGLVTCAAEARCLARLGESPWIGASLHSFLLAVLSALFAAAATAAFVLASARTRRFWTYFFCVSPALLGAAWLQLPFEEFLRGRPWAQLLFAAFALTLVQMPFLSYWVRSRVDSLREELFESARLLGLPRARMGFFLKLPLCRDLVARAALLSGCLALGELAITSLFVRDAALLASQARLLATRYDFAGGALALALTCVLAGALMLLISPWLRKRRPA